jgi:hypothetical protein
MAKDAVYHRKPKYEDPDKDNRPNTTEDQFQMEKSGQYKTIKGSKVMVDKAIAVDPSNVYRGKNAFPRKKTYGGGK